VGPLFAWLVCWAPQSVCLEGECEMTIDYVETVKEARNRLVADRRSVLKQLAKPYERGATERAREALVAIQAAVEALDRALVDEEALAGDQAIEAALRNMSDDDLKL
jgi:DNA-binding SARP family transcriptional activator